MKYYNKDGDLVSTVPSSGSDDAVLTLRVTIEPETSNTVVAATYTVFNSEAADRFIKPIYYYDLSKCWLYGLYI